MTVSVVLFSPSALRLIYGLSWYPFVEFSTYTGGALGGGTMGTQPTRRSQRCEYVCIPHVNQHLPVCWGSMWTGCKVCLDRKGNGNSGVHHKEHKQQRWKTHSVTEQAKAALDSFVFIYCKCCIYYNVWLHKHEQKHDAAHIFDTAPKWQRAITTCRRALSHTFISIFMKRNHNKKNHVMKVDIELFQYQNLQRKSWCEGLEKFETVPFNPEALLFSLKSPVSYLLSCPPLFLTHIPFCYQFKAQRGQGGSVSGRQVVTQMMTNWPPLRSPPNQVQTWLSCAYLSCKLRSMAVRWSSQSLKSAFCHRHVDRTSA